MRIPYRVTPAWITASLRKVGRIHPEADRPVGSVSHLFDAALSLLPHEAMGPAPPNLDLDLPRRLEHSFRSPRTRQFVRDASKVSGTELVVRESGAWLASNNVLTTGFIPPRASDVAPMLSFLLKAIEGAQLAAGGHTRVAVRALVANQLFLTIHPFRDGNGRTARLFFAAQLSRFGVPDPAALLALALIYRQGCHQYHQASWLFRAGDPQPMIDLYLGSIPLAVGIVDRFARAEGEPGEQGQFLRHCWRELRAMR